MEILSRAQFHGARRLADKRDRFWWGAFLLVLLASALAALVSAAWRYRCSPTYLARAGSRPRGGPPFPCVLICPEILYPNHKIDDLLRDLTLPQGMNKSWLNDNMHSLAALYSPDVAYSVTELETLEYVLDYNHLNVEEVTRNLTLTCDEMLLRCRFRQRIRKCSRLFKMELTTYGYCCVFNGRSLHREINNIGVEPLREREWAGSRVGLMDGLVVAVDQRPERVSDVDLSYKWVTVQLSQQYVECSSNGTPLAPATELWLGYGREDVRTAEEARELSYSLRKCRFSYESLHFFPVYTKEYCNLECSMLRSMQRCQCSPLTYPRAEGIPYCRARSLQCARGAAVPYGSDKCDCPMPCDMERDFTVTQTYEFSNDTVPFDSFYKDLNLQKTSIVRVFIPSRKVRTFYRRAVFDSISIFSQMGGVFSVFFGCSILTLLELAQLFYRVLCHPKTAKCQPRDDADSPVFIRKKKAAKQRGKGNKMRF